MSEPRMQVSSGADRRTQRDQIEEVLRNAKQFGDVLRVRIPFSLYDHVPGNRQYVNLRQATWTLSLPVATTTAETVEELIQTIGICIVAIAQQGPEAIKQLLAGGAAGETGEVAVETEDQEP